MIYVFRFAKIIKYLLFNLLYKVNEWTHKLRKEGYQLDRQIRSIQREEEKVKRTLKEAAKKNDKDTCIILAKELIRSRKAITRIYTSKAHLNSVSLQMKNQLGMIFSNYYTIYVHICVLLSKT